MTRATNAIDYIEFPGIDLEATKRFFNAVFGWTFTDWGSDYVSFSGAGIDGGFNRVDGRPVTAPGVLVVLYADDLETAAAAVTAAGGTLVKLPYPFPGGRRFHFLDPNGTELAVWSE